MFFYGTDVIVPFFEKAQYIKKEHYSNFCTFEIASLVNGPEHYLWKYGMLIVNDIVTILLVLMTVYNYEINYFSKNSAFYKFRLVWFCSVSIRETKICLVQFRQNGKIMLWLVTAVSSYQKCDKQGLSDSKSNL